MPVYLDHNATTPLRREARARWLEVTDSLAANPSSLHTAGRRARSIVDDARMSVAAALGTREDEITFTSGGTESNNLALQGSFPSVGPPSAQGGLVTTRVEHSSVLASARALERRGVPVTRVGVDRLARADLAQLEQALARSPVRLVSVMAANNEVGTLGDLESVAGLLDDGQRTAASRPLFHTDAVQALGKIPVRLGDWKVDLASFSAHKVGGPVGVGVLFKRAGVSLAPLFFGGGQENELRPGTESVAGIAAAARAITLAVEERESFAAQTTALTVFLWEELQRALPEIQCLGPRPGDHDTLPNTLCVRLVGTDGKVLVTRLDLEGLEAGAGSACANGSLEPSHVLAAMGYGETDARAGLRLSLGRSTSRAECERAMGLLKKLFGPSRAT